MPIGAFAFLYRNVGSVSSWANPSWEEVENTRDVMVSNQFTTIDFPVRGRGKVSAPLRGIQRLRLNFTLRYQNDDPDFEDIWQRHLNDDKGIDLWAADSETGDNKAFGWRCEWLVSLALTPQPLDDLMTVDFECVPRGVDGSNGPLWYQA